MEPPFASSLRETKAASVPGGERGLKRVEPLFSPLSYRARYCTTSLRLPKKELRRRGMAWDSAGRSHIRNGSCEVKLEWTETDLGKLKVRGCMTSTHVAAGGEQRP